METMNKAQAQALFAERAILIGSVDAIPEKTVAELFGEAAVAHAHTLDNGGELCNAYGVGDYTAPYLTLSGFMRAVTYHNIRKLETQQKELVEGWEAFTQDDYNGLVWGLYNQWLDDTKTASEGDKAEARRVKDHFAEIMGISTDSPAALAYSFFWAGVGKGIEVFSTITGEGARA